MKVRNIRRKEKESSSKKKKKKEKRITVSTAISKHDSIPRSCNSVNKTHEKKKRIIIEKNEK